MDPDSSQEEVVAAIRRLVEIEKEVGRILARPTEFYAIIPRGSKS